LKQTVFTSQQCAMSKVATSVHSAVFRPGHWPTVVLPLVYFPVANSLFEVSPEIHCSDMSSLYCCCGNHTAGSKPIWKLFRTSIENWI